MRFLLGLYCIKTFVDSFQTAIEWRHRVLIVTMISFIDFNLYTPLPCRVVVRRSSLVTTSDNCYYMCHFVKLHVINNAIFTCRCTNHEWLFILYSF